MASLQSIFDHPHDIVEIKAGGQVLRSTEGHPFWVIEGEGLARRPKPEHIVKAELEGTTVPGRWVDSHDLLVGDVLLLKDGKPTRISEISRVGYSGQVHNLTVADYNNYAIGDAGVLVHNNCDVKPYKEVRKEIAGSELEAHHLLEGRFAKILGEKVRDMLSIPLTKAAHQVFTNAWRRLIPYKNSTSLLNTSTATREEIFAAARQVYADFPHLLQALGL